MSFIKKSALRNMVMDLSAICRCCLNPGNLKSVFSGNKSKTSILYNEMIQHCCQIPVSENDGLPTQICKKCITKLKSSYNFKQHCIESNNKLLSLKDSLNEKCENTELKIVQLQSEVHNDGKLIFRNNKDSNENETSDLCHNKDDVKMEIKLEPSFVYNDDIFAMTETAAEVDDNHSNDNAFELLDNNEDTLPDVKKKRKYKVRGTSRGLESTKVKKKRLKLKCELCDEVFTQSLKLQEHVYWVHNGIKPYHCPICDKDYANEKWHRQKHQTNPFTATCDVCGETFTSQYSYKNHIELHGNKEYKCDCGATFKIKAYLRSHKRTVHGQKNYLCHFCSKAFTKKYRLVEHIEVHTREKPFECHLCHLRFSHRGVLSRHLIYRHSEVRAFQCVHCHMCFKTKCALVHHLVVHEETRRYACRVCCKPFGRSDNRNVHERSVHGISKEEAKSMWPSPKMRYSQ